MKDLDTYYEIISQALPDDEPVSVVSFTGQEGLSQLFTFDIELKSRSQKIDIDALLGEPCALKMTVGGISRRINGELLQWDTLGQSGDFVIYQAKLVPRAYSLSQYRSNEVHIEETLPAIIENVLKQCGLTELDYDFRLEGDYPVLPLCCQFDETYLDFISRLMERVGIYYFFEHQDDSDRLIICDSLRGQDTLENPELQFRAPSGQNLYDFPDSVHALICRQKRLPARVVFKDYNDENPSVNIQGQAEVDPQGIGEVYDYGSHVNSPDEAKNLARITAEQLLSEKRRYYGESTVGRMQAGFLVSIKGHLQANLNSRYQLISIEHEGHSPSLQTGELQRGASYNNRFTAIEGDTQFRAARLTAKPRFFGTMNAFIDSETDGEYAQVDSTGRYKVIFPFDRVARQEAKASCWIRMAQPYAGEGEGMHFPLRKNAEVLLTFIGGDPDRPVIAGAVPNHSKPSVIIDQNQTKNVIHTSKGNRIEIEDREDCRRIKLHSPHKNTYMHLGAPNHEGDGWVLLTEGLERKVILGGRQVTFDTGGPEEAPFVFGGSSDSEELTDNNSTLTHGRSLFTFKKQNNDGVAPLDGEADVGSFLEDIDELSGRYLIQRARGPKYQWHQGANFSYHTGPSRTVSFADNGPDTAEDAPLITKDYTSLEADLLEDLYKNVGSDSDGYNITDGALAYGKAGNNSTLTSKDWVKVIRDAHVSLSQHDTITGQKGNIYDFGGYWNYNLGNSYEENHISQQTKINQTGDYDILATGGPEEGSLKSELGNIKLNDEQWRVKDVLGNHSALTPDTLWTSKTYGGDSYDYRCGGNAIEVNESVNTMEIKKAGKHVEFSFNSGGTLTSWASSADGKSTEKKWHSRTGNILEDSTKTLEDGGFSWNNKTYHSQVPYKLETIEKGRNSVAGTDVYSASFMGKSSASLEFGACSSFSLAMNARVSLSIDIAANRSVNISAAEKIDINISASKNAELNLGASMSMKLSATAGVELIGEVTAGPTVKFGKKPIEIDVRNPAVEVTTKGSLGQFALSLPGVSLTSKSSATELKAAGFTVNS